MRPHACRHEDALLEAIASGAWPAEAEASLRAHVAACPVCRDLAAVVPLLHDDRLALCAEARVPTAGAVWWRAQVRARAEAERAAMRPMLVAAAWGATVLVAVLAALVTIGWPSGEILVGDGVDALRRLRPSLHVSVDVATLVPWLVERWLVPTILTAFLLVAAPVVLYVAARD